MYATYKPMFMHKIKSNELSENLTRIFSISNDLNYILLIMTFI